MLRCGEVTSRSSRRKAPGSLGSERFRNREQGFPGGLVVISAAKSLRSNRL